MKTLFKNTVRITVLLTVLFISNLCQSQSLTGEIRGKVTDKTTRAILDYATIVVKQGDLVKASTSSDENGNYFIKGIDSGTYTINVTFVGYTKYMATGIKVTSGCITFWNVELSVKIDNGRDLQAVEIISFKRKLVEEDANKSSLSSKEIRKLPQRGVGSIANTSSGTNRGSFLGSRTDGTRIFVDGVPVIASENHPASYNISEKLNIPLENGTESYAKIKERGFLNPYIDPLSTFSIDVDKASYSNTRRFLNQGYLPPPDAVRIEELINYFDYNYPEPKQGETVAMNSELGYCPWNKEHYLLKIGLNAKKINEEQRQNSNLVFLIDVSGSMSDENKLPLVKKSLIMLLEHLDKKDRVALVVYAGNSGLVLPSTSCDNKEEIEMAIKRLESGGSTAGGAGIQLAYKVAKENFIKNGINRVILATDGDFNVGVNSESDLEDLIAKERKSNIFLSVLGFGTGNYQDSKMEILADKGNGNYAYIDNILEARKILVNELNETLITVAKDVKIQIEFNPQYVESYRLIGYENRILNAEDFNNDKKDAGEMGSGSTVTALYEITLVKDKNLQEDGVDSLRYINRLTQKTSVFKGELAFMKLRYKNTLDSTSKLITRSISNNPVEKPGDDFQFAAAVAQFGMLLRDSEFKGESEFGKAITLAKKGKDEDPEGEKAEFIKLVSLARELKK